MVLLLSTSECSPLILHKWKKRRKAITCEERRSRHLPWYLLLILQHFLQNLFYPGEPALLCEQACFHTSTMIQFSHSQPLKKLWSNWTRVRRVPLKKLMSGLRANERREVVLFSFLSPDMIIVTFISPLRFWVAGANRFFCVCWASLVVIKHASEINHLCWLWYSSVIWQLE